MAATTTRRPASASRTGPAWLGALRDERRLAGPGAAGPGPGRGGACTRPSPTARSAFPRRAGSRWPWQLISLGTLGALLYGLGVARAGLAGGGLGRGACCWRSPAGRRCRSPGRSPPTRAGSRPTARWPTRWWSCWAWCWAPASRVPPSGWAWRLLAIATVIAVYALGGEAVPVAAHRRRDRPEPHRPLLAPARAAGLLERPWGWCARSRSPSRSCGRGASVPGPRSGWRGPWRWCCC